MKRKRFEKWISLGLAAVMVLSLAGCGNKDGGQSGKAKSIDKDHIFSAAELELPEKLNDVSSLSIVGDRIYVVGTNYEGDTGVTYLCSIGVDGSDAKAVKIATGLEMEQTDNTGDMPGMDDGFGVDVAEDGARAEDAAEEQDVAEDAAAEEITPEEAEKIAADGQFTTLPMDDSAPVDMGEYRNVWVNSYALDEKGQLYAVAEVYHEWPDENGDYQSESQWFLYCWNENGEVLWNKNLNQEFQVDDYIYVSSILCDQNGLIWLQSDQVVAAYDADGNMVKKKQLSQDESSNMGNFIKIRNENFATLVWNDEYTKQSLKFWNTDSMTLDADATELPEGNAISNGSFYSGGSYSDFVVVGNGGSDIYIYNVGDTQPTLLMNLIDSDLNISMSQICMVDDTHFVAIYSDRVNWDTHVGYFTKVDPKDIQDKQLISLAGMWIDSDMKNRIVEFNKKNEQYRIQIKEYENYSTDDYMAGYTQLNNDIIAGNMPDILLVDSNMPFESYVAKGLIADIYPLIDADQELNREDYLQNVMDAFSTDGKLYRLVPSFSVYTVLAKSSIVGKQIGWTLEDYKALMEKLPEGTASFSMTTRSDILSSGLQMTENEYVDHDTGKCSFDSQAFVDFLEFANTFPAEINYDDMDEDYWNSYETMFREDRAILSGSYLSSYSDFNYAEKGTFGEDITPIGFPTASKNGNALMAENTYAISAKTKCMDGVWEFLRYYLTEEYQDTLSYGFPVMKSMIEKMEKEATELPYWIDDDGNKQTYTPSYYINGVNVDIDPMNQEEAQEFTAFLESVTMVQQSDTSLNNIVSEEAEAYFSGQKTAKEVADIIQSRAQIYISENR